MNKTLLLTAVNAHTEGSMLIVIDSVEEYAELFSDYHTKKRDFLIGKLPNYYNRSKKNEEWYEVCQSHEKLEKEFILENNNKPFDFEITTGCCYIHSGKGQGNFYDGVKIIKSEKEAKASQDRHGCWLLVKEFLSDLPRGTHYCGDYCA